MSTEIRLLAVVELINTKVDTLGTELGSRIDKNSAGLALLASRIDETNARLGQVETSLGSRIDETNARLGQVETSLGSRIDETNSRLGKLEQRFGTTERLIEGTNQRLDTMITVMTDGFQSLNEHSDLFDNRLTKLERRVDKLEEAG